MIRSPTILAIALLVCAAPAFAQSPEEVGPQEVRSSFRAEREPAPAGLVEVYQALAESWGDENAAGIARLSGGGRVHLVVERAGIRERLVASQLQYALEELFESSRELVFRFPVLSTYDPASDTGYAVGERTFREREGLDATTDRVFVAARMERGRWVLTELRLAVR